MGPEGPGYFFSI